MVNLRIFQAHQSTLLVHSLVMACVLANASAHGQSADGNRSAGIVARKIVLISGETAKQDVVGHHDYLGGCKCLAALLPLTPGVHTEIVTEGWPEDEGLFDKASAEFEKQSQNWLGGIYVNGPSGRGHWPSSHVDFPEHPITRGVTPWKVIDGWLNQLQFVPDMRGITPLVWSGKTYAGSRSGRDADVVGWAFERPGGGRSFGFTGLDAHSAWSLTGMRQLVVNGVLWSAGLDIPAAGAQSAIDDARLTSYLTLREPKRAKKAN